MSDIDFSVIKSFTQAQFNELKAQYGKAFILTIDDGGELIHFAVVRPDQSLISAMGDYAAKNDAAKVNELLAKNLVKLGDTGKLNDGVIYLTVVEQLGKMVEPVKSFLKKG